MTEKKSGPAWAMASMLRHTVSGSAVGRGGNTSKETSVERRGRRTSQDVRAGGSEQGGSGESGLGGGAAGAPARQVAAVGTPLGRLAPAGSCPPVEEAGPTGAAEPAGWAPDA